MKLETGRRRRRCCKDEVKDRAFRGQPERPSQKIHLALHCQKLHRQILQGCFVGLLLLKLFLRIFMNNDVAGLRWNVLDVIELSNGF
jgi:hypothetical protein